MAPRWLHTSWSQLPSYKMVLPPISSVLWELSMVSFDCIHPPSLSSQLLPQFPTIWWLEAEPLISLWHLKTLSLLVPGSLRIRRCGLVRRSVPLGIDSRFQKPPALLSALSVLPVCHSEMWASICSFSQYACCLLPWWPPVMSSFSVSFSSFNLLYFCISTAASPLSSLLTPSPFLPLGLSSPLRKGATFRRLQGSKAHQAALRASTVSPIF